MPLWRIHPVVHPSDSRWQGRPIWAEVIVRAETAAMARVIAAGDFMPDPGAERLAQYYDDPTKAGIVIAMVWAMIGIFVGDWVAWLLAYPEMTFDPAWAGFGRLRPVPPGSAPRSGKATANQR